MRHETREFHAICEVCPDFVAHILRHVGVGCGFELSFEKFEEIADHGIAATHMDGAKKLCRAQILIDARAGRRHLV